MKKLKKNKPRTGKARRAAGKFFSLPAALAFPAVTVTILLALGCQPNQTVLKDVAVSPTPMETVEAKKTSLEEDLQEMRTANFGFIYVFRRKDGGGFDKDDQKYLRDNTPTETSRWRRSDDGKAFIAGSNFTFNPEQLAALRSRFIIEDYSTPEAKEAARKAFSEPQANAPVNTGSKNSNASDQPANR